MGHSQGCPLPPHGLTFPPQLRSPPASGGCVRPWRGLRACLCRIRAVEHGEANAQQLCVGRCSSDHSKRATVTLSRGARGRGAGEARLSWVSASGGERSPPPWNTGHVFNLSTRQNISQPPPRFLYPAELTGNVKSTRMVGSRDSEDLEGSRKR